MNSNNGTLLTLVQLLILAASATEIIPTDDIKTVVAIKWFEEIDYLENCNYETLTDTLKSIHYLYRDLTELETIGTSFGGKELWNLIVTNKNVSEYNSKDERIYFKKQIKFVGNINGYSGPACVTLLKLAKHLVNVTAISNSSSDLLKFSEIHIVPNLNPDGYERSFPGNCKSLAGRANGNDTFLNSNFPDDFNAPEPFEKDDRIEQSETKAVRKWIEDNSFVLSVSLTSGTTTIIYPWGMAPNFVPRGQPFHVPAPDADAFDSLCRLYADILDHQGYTWECKDDVKVRPKCQNGAEGRRAAGSMMDYNYNHGVQEISVGLGCCVNENHPEALNYIFHAHIESLMQMIVQAVISYRRRIIDGDTGKPIRKAIVVPIEINSKMVDPEYHFVMPVYTDHDGIFNRLFAAGNYTFLISHRDYNDHIFHVEFPKDVSSTDMTAEQETIKMYRTNRLPQGEKFVEVEANEGSEIDVFIFLKELFEKLKPTEKYSLSNRTSDIIESSTKAPPNRTAVEISNGASVSNSQLKMMLLPILYLTNKFLFC